MISFAVKSSGDQTKEGGISNEPCSVLARSAEVFQLVRAVARLVCMLWSTLCGLLSILQKVLINI